MKSTAHNHGRRLPLPVMLAIVAVRLIASATATRTLTRGRTDPTGSHVRNSIVAGSSSSAAKAVPPSSSSSTWDKLDKRPVPAWYGAAKFGIFLHWGVFSVPSYEEWFWYNWQNHQEPAHVDFINRTERANFAYPDYAHRFLAELYNPQYWAEQIFAPSGAQYVVLTSKHHEGFCMWDSRNIPTTWNWNVMEVGPRRDLLGELAAAIKQTKSPYSNQFLKFGVYHSLFEWFNPLFLQDQANHFNTSYFVDLKTGPEMYDLVRRYEPEILWSDGDWLAPSSYWKSTEFLSWYAYNSTVAKTAVWNDRWGTDTTCKHGAFLTCKDKFQPGKVISKKWEQCNTVDKSAWAYNRKATYSQYRTIPELIYMLIATVATNGNLLLNVGPASDGTIHPIFVDRLLGIGDWLKVNGPAIYGTQPWSVCTDEKNVSVYYTKKQQHNDEEKEGGAPVLFAHMTKWPAGNVLELSCPVVTNATRVYMLGLTADRDDDAVRANNEEEEGGGGIAAPAGEGAGPVFMTWRRRSRGGGLTITLPALTPDRLPCHHAWVLVITGIGNLHEEEHGRKQPPSITTTTTI